MGTRAPFLPLVALAAGLALGGCSDGAAEPDHHDDEGPVGQSVAFLKDTDTVESVVNATCSTVVVKKLSIQLIQELECLSPNTMERVDNIPNFSLGEAVIPFLQKPAAEALKKVLQARPGQKLSTNSALRALPQQYLLFRWQSRPECRISLAARPGTSNHESALAVDTSDYTAWRAAFENNGWNWLGDTTNDDVHFDYVGAGRKDIRGLSVKAFQRLWNRNHPEDLIDEDGDYGPTTETRLRKAPIGGFPKGAMCDAKPDGGAPASADGGASGSESGPGESPSGSGSTSADGGASGDDRPGAQPSAAGFGADESSEDGGCSVHGSSTRGLAAFGLGAIALLVAGRRRRSK